MDEKEKQTLTGFKTLLGLRLSDQKFKASKIQRKPPPAPSKGG
jgi:hypothetical protein